MNISSLTAIVISTLFLQADYGLLVEADSAQLTQHDPLILRIMVVNESAQPIPSLMGGEHSIQVSVTKGGSEGRVACGFFADQNIFSVHENVGERRMLVPGARETTFAIVLWVADAKFKHLPAFIFSEAGNYSVVASIAANTGRLTSEPLSVVVSGASKSHVAAAEVGISDLGPLLSFKPMASLDAMPPLTARSLNRHLDPSHLKTLFRLSLHLRDLESGVVNGEIHSKSRAGLASMRPKLSPLQEQVTARRLAEFYLRQNHLNDAQREADRLDPEVADKSMLLHAIESRRKELRNAADEEPRS
jgi:hypothetical protein